MLKELFTAENSKWMQPQGMRLAIQRYLEEEKSGVFELQIKRVSDRRTHRQNSYLWKLCEILAAEIGYESKESVLAIAMENRGMGKYVQWKGRERFERDSSALKDKEQFGRIIDELHEMAAFLNEGREPSEHLILPGKELGMT